MAYFAIVRDNAEDKFEVAACHINLWLLPATFRRRVFVCDIGLRLRAVDKELSTFGIALPVGTYDVDANGLEDLFELMKNPVVAELVFGKPVSSNNSRIKYSSLINGALKETELNLTPISEGDTQIKKHLSGKTFTYWSIKLEEAIKPNPIDSYVRLRFKVRNVGRVWTWKTANFTRVGALLDIRTSDVRGSYVENVSWRKHQSRIAKIDRLSVFAIVPSWLQLRATSPEYYYMRIFEGRVWEPYLARPFDLNRKEKLVIYQWRSDRAIDTNNPHRVLLDLNNDFKLVKIANSLLVLIFVSLWVLVAVVVFTRSDTTNVTEAIANVLPSLKSITVFGILTAVAVVGWNLYRHWERFKQTATRFRNWFLRREQNKLKSDVNK
jgi:hypothetical protein